MPTKRQIKVHGHLRWQVDFGRTHGQRLRPTFESEAEADDAIEKRRREARRHGEAWLLLSSDERYEIMAVHSEVRRAGLSLRQVWDGYRTQGKLPVVADSIAYEEAVKEWTARKLRTGKDERYVREAGELLLRFGRGQLRRPIGDIAATELEQWIDAQKWNLATRKSNMGRFASLWTVAVDKNWAAHNIVARLEPVGKISVEPEIFSNETCLRLMAASLQPQCNRVIAPIALGLFGGMRPEEADHDKFGWHRICLKRGIVTVPGAVAKTSDRRTFKLQPVALEWLRLARELGNPLPPVNERRLIDLACTSAGITHWPHDVLRKTCATHLRNRYEDDWHVIRDLGNSIRMLLKHYVDLHVPGKQSREFWKITPAAARKELRRMIAAGTVASPVQKRKLHEDDI